MRKARERPHLHRGSQLGVFGGGRPDDRCEVGGFDHGGEIASVVLIRPGSTTHSVNTSQRYLALEFEAAGPTTLRVSAPEHGNLAPPGYYMLFILNGKGVPSVASMIRLRPGPPTEDESSSPVAPRPASQDLQEPI